MTEDSAPPPPTESEPTAGDAAGAGPPSLPVRIAQVFFSPGALFEALSRHPVWIGALVVLIAINLVTNMLVPEEVVRAAIEARGGSDMTAEQIDQTMSFLAVWGWVLAVVGSPIVILVVAAVLLLVYNVLTGGEGTFRQLFSATTHAMYIYTLGGILTLALILGGAEVTTQLSLGLLVPGLEEGYLARFLNGLNVFSLWTAAVLGIAVSRIYPQKSAGSAALTIIGLYVVLVAIFTTFGGGG